MAPSAASSKRRPLARRQGPAVSDGRARRPVAVVTREVIHSEEEEEEDLIDHQGSDDEDEAGGGQQGREEGLDVSSLDTSRDSLEGTSVTASGMSKSLRSKSCQGVGVALFAKSLFTKKNLC
jgi:hypothetical protein